jgi:hypothetical protein
MDRIELLCLNPGEVDHPAGNDLQSAGFKPGIDFTDEVAPDGVWLYDGKSTFNGHSISPVQ